jgi:hypothetical protein
MSRLSVVLVIALGLIGLVAVIVGVVRIVVTQTRAAAPEAALPAPQPAGQDQAPAAVALAPSAMVARDIVRSVMPALISIVLLIPSSLIVVSRNRPPEHQRWATATISSIVTYWLTGRA